jgi:hypothetical protein
MFYINHAQNLSVNYQNISYHARYFIKFEEINMILFVHLTLHHFKDNEILDQLCFTNLIGIVINDLPKKSITYRLFQVVCALQLK